MFSWAEPDSEITEPASPPALVRFETVEAVRASLGPFKRELDELLFEAGQIVITDANSAAKAVETGNVLRKLAGKLESLRKVKTGPILDHKASIDGLFKMFTDPAKSAESELKNKIGEFTRQERARIEAEQRAERARAEAEAENQKRLEEQLRLEEEAAKAGIEPPPPPVLEPPKVAPVKQAIKTEAGGITEVTRWTFEVTDKAAVPEEYKLVDTAKIQKLIDAGMREISGVRIYQETKTRWTR